MKYLLTTFLLLLIAFAGRAQEKNFIDQPYVEVTGSADTAVMPDEIYLRILLSEADSKNRISLEAQEVQMVAALRSLGLNTEKDLAVGDAGSDFKSYFIRGKQVLKTKTYILKVGNAPNIGRVMEKLESIDISNISLDRVRYSDAENLQNALRTKAVAAAKTQALAITKGVGQILGAAIFLGELPSLEPIRSNALTISGGYKSEASILEFEKLRFSVRVNAKFLLRSNTY